jgi:hypothetical protein
MVAEAGKAHAEAGKAHAEAGKAHAEAGQVPRPARAEDRASLIAFTRSPRE